MSGQSNRGVALALLKELDPTNFKGVVFFNKPRAWVFLDASGREWELHKSPIKERDAFVFFDQHHCRGADMVLKPEARALLTVGPKTCKDVLMQAAGRMRQLAHKQSIVFLGADDVTTNIRSAAGVASALTILQRSKKPITSKDVLDFVMRNTVAFNVNALAAWAGQGFHFCTTIDKPSQAVLPEILSLQHMYGSRREDTAVPDVVNSIREFYTSRVAERGQSEADAVASLQPARRALIRRIGKEAGKWGQDVKRPHATSNGGMAIDEECERELEQEEELEQEVCGEKKRGNVCVLVCVREGRGGGVIRD